MNANNFTINVLSERRRAALRAHEPLRARALLVRRLVPDQLVAAARAARAFGRRAHPPPQAGRPHHALPTRHLCAIQLAFSSPLSFLLQVLLLFPRYGEYTTVLLRGSIQHTVPEIVNVNREISK